MGKDIRKHVQECDVCQRTKPSNNPPAGRLHPLSIPGRSWESIGMDNLGSVPKSAIGKDMILIVIDRLTKMARFIPTYSINYQQRNSGSVPTGSISASWTIIEYCIGQRPPFYGEILGCFTESIRCAIANVNRCTSSD